MSLLLFSERADVRHKQLNLARIERGLERRHVVLAILDLCSDLRVGELLNFSRRQIFRVQRLAGRSPMPIVAVADGAIGFEERFTRISSFCSRGCPRYRQEKQGTRCSRDDTRADHEAKPSLRARAGTPDPCALSHVQDTASLCISISVADRSNTPGLSHRAPLIWSFCLTKWLPANGNASLSHDVLSVDANTKPPGQLFRLNTAPEVKFRVSFQIPGGTQRDNSSIPETVWGPGTV